MGERLPYKQDVIGSSPIVSTKPRIRAHLASFLHGPFFMSRTSVIYALVSAFALTFESLLRLPGVFGKYLCKIRILRYGVLYLAIWLPDFGLYFD